MARQPRIEYDGAFYHVMSRGDRREAIFEDDRDREMFLETLGECCYRSGWRIYAWVLMSNHYHWVLQTPQGNLVAGMKWFQNTYTRRLNTRHKKWGHVFGGRYKAVVVEEDSGGEYLTTLMDYVHLNPARAGLVGGKRALIDYPWSSLARGYAVLPKHRKEWLAVAEGLELFGWSDRTADRRSFVERLEQRAREDRGEVVSPHEGLQNRLERGWYWGSQSFREKMLKLVKGKGRNRNYRSSALMQDEQKNQAEEWLERGRKHFKLTGPLAEAPRLARVSIAWALHRRTNQPQGWIASELGLRTAANVSQQVRRFGTLVDEGKFRRDKLVSAWAKFVNNC